MKHIYNPTKAAYTQRPSAKAMGTAAVSKILSLLLISFFLLVSGESVGQQAPTPLVGPLTFTDLNNVYVQTVTGNFEGNTNSGQLRTFTATGKDAYDLYIALRTSINLRKGYKYTVSFNARALDHNQGGIGDIRVYRGDQFNVDWRNVTPSLASREVLKSSLMDSYSISFTATEQSLNQYLALRLSSTGGNQSQLFLTNLVITESCTPEPPVVINGGSCTNNVQVTMFASGAKDGIEEYQWYRSNGTAINGETGSSYQTENLQQSRDYFVAIRSKETGCLSALVPVSASVNGLKAPTVNMTSGSCEGGGNEEKTFTATGGSAGSYRWYQVGSTTPITVNGQTVTGSTLTRNTNSQGGSYYVVIVGSGCQSAGAEFKVEKGYPSAPSTATGRICGNQLTLTATGADFGQSYNWYSTVAGVTSFVGRGATVVTNITSNASYSVSKVNIASGCESTTRLTIDTNNITINFKDTESVPATGTIVLPSNPIVGQPATFGYSRSSSLDINDITNHTWVIHYTDGTKSPAISTGAVQTFTIEQMPDNLTGIELFLTLGPNGCYRTALNGVITISNTTITPLPVELMFFKAHAQTKGVNLTWATASELENKGFEIQVSTNARDFKAIGFVESKVGTTMHTQHYSFLDTKAVSGTRYYRLKQIDFDGTTSYSPIRAVALNSDNATITAYPNPFDDAVVVTLNGTEARNVQVLLMDAMGKVLQQRTEETSGNSVTVDMRSITTKGMYVLHVLDNDTKHTFKLMKR